MKTQSGKTLAIAIIALFAGASLSHAGLGDLADMAKKKATEEAKKQATDAAVKTVKDALYGEEDLQSQAKVSGKPALKECDDIFNPSKKFCYDGEIYDLCDGMSYNPTTHICSGDIAKRASCNGAQYNPLKQKCENNAILTVCGATTYDPATHGCKDNAVFALSKCGATFYDPATQVCKDNILLTICGATTYDNKAKFCDFRNGKIYKFVAINTQTWMAENLNYNVGISKCYDNKPDNCDKYGMLYNWETAKTACPSGWHLPSKAEWEALTGSAMYGFSAMLGGYGSNDKFNSIDSYGYWWSASEYNSDYAYTLYTGYSKKYDWYSRGKSYLFSVRCIKDN